MLTESGFVSTRPARDSHVRGASNPHLRTRDVRMP